VSERYLILHKVRGEPAFDIAQKIEVEDEEWWIIPTSGHRAYPSKIWKLEDWRCTYANSTPLLDPRWASLPDHYTIHDEVKRYGGRVNALLAKLGLGKRYSNLKIRPL